MNSYIECVPNISEGRNLKVIDSIQNAILKIPKVTLLEVSSNYDAHRTVFTFVGNIDVMYEATFQMVKVASNLIDMTQHKGIHPRIGAVDVCPFIPLQNSTFEECKILAQALGERIAKDLKLSGYYYGKVALEPYKEELSSCRKGEYEEIQKKITLKQWYPDFGPLKVNTKFGMMLIGVREFLIAYNLNLNTTSIEIAKKIAEKIRGSGKQPSKYRLNTLKAIGWNVPEYGFAQVSTNITNFYKTELYKVWNTANIIAQKYDVSVTGSELIGLIPLEALLLCAKSMSLNLKDTKKALQKVIQYLGLEQLKPFDINKKILEFAIGSKERKD